MSENGIVTESEHQTQIANFCNDSSRELNYLTNEINQSDNYDYDRQSSSTSSSNANVMQMNKEHENVPQQQQDDSQKCDSKNKFINNDVDSSPFYTQLSQNVEINDVYTKMQQQQEQQQRYHPHESTPMLHRKEDSHDTIDGCNVTYDTDGSNENNMLHSVNLNGKIITHLNLKKKIINGSCRHIFTTTISRRITEVMAW